jgi:hypothetical protein
MTLEDADRRAAARTGTDNEVGVPVTRQVSGPDPNASGERWFEREHFEVERTGFGIERSNDGWRTLSRPNLDYWVWKWSPFRHHPSFEERELQSSAQVLQSVNVQVPEVEQAVQGHVSGWEAGDDESKGRGNSADQGEESHGGLLCVKFRQWVKMIRCRMLRVNLRSQEMLS